MRKVLVIIGALLFCSAALSQEEVVHKERKNEISFNAMNLIIFKKLQVSYERALNEESSLGVSLLTKLGSNTAFEVLSEGDYAITPYYRHHFQLPFDNVYFTTGAFTMIHSGLNDLGSTPKKYNDVAFGITTGTKFISKRGFIYDTYGGFGRNFFDKNAPVLLVRFAISFGYQF